MPTEDRLRRHDRRDLLQCRLAPSFADRRQRDPLFVGQPQSAIDLTPQNPVLGHQVFDSQMQLLIDAPAQVSNCSQPIRSLACVGRTIQAAGSDAKVVWESGYKSAVGMKTLAAAAGNGSTGVLSFF